MAEVLKTEKGAGQFRARSRCPEYIIVEHDGIWWTLSWERRLDNGMPRKGFRFIRAAEAKSRREEQIECALSSLFFQHIYLDAIDANVQITTKEELISNIHSPKYKSTAFK